MNKAALPAAVALLIAACGNAGQPSAAVPATTPAAGTSTTAPIETAAATTTTPTAGPAAVTDTLNGGRYLFRTVSGVNVVATGPDGWVGYPSWAMDGPEPVKADAPSGIGVVFFNADDGLYRDPCHWDVAGSGRADVGDVKVGPTVDDLVAALRANTFYTSTPPKPVTIDGYSGQELELQLPAEPEYGTCDNESGDTKGHVFVFGGVGLYAQGQANRWHLYVLEVKGTRLVAVILSYAGTPKADLDTALDVIHTMDINP